MILKEIWKDIDGFEGRYQVSNLGNVKNYRSVLKGGSFSNGYKFVNLTKAPYDSHNYLIHRLVAEAFIPNPLHLEVVNHLDGNKENNSVDNLEWCTAAQNIAHAIEIGLIESQCKIRRKVTISNSDQNITFNSMKECASFFGFKKSWLHDRLYRFGNDFSFNGYSFHIHERDAS